MKILINILLPLSLIFSISNYCTCPSLDKKMIKYLKSESDLIVTGKPVKIFNIDNAHLGYEMVQFDIDSIIKGDQNISCIMIDQNSVGNCGVFFEIGEEYLITGEKIESAKQTYSMTQKSHSNELETIINENYTISTSNCRSFNLSTIAAKEFLNELGKN